VRVEEQLVGDVRDAVVVVVRIVEIADVIVIPVGGRARRAADVGAIRGFVRVEEAVESLSVIDGSELGSGRRRATAGSSG
jgi:hypothetical protein